MQAKLLWMTALGVCLGVAGTVATRDQWARAADVCGLGCKTKPPASVAACPVQLESGKVVVTNAPETERLRSSLMRGVFEPWFELGRAPTPEEVGARLELDRAATGALMDRLAGCGAAMRFGVHRVPESDLIAVAWPLSNVPTAIEVTVEGKKPVFARCAVDALGISKMMGRRASIVATSRDGAGLRIDVDGAELLQATPAEAVVFDGGSCDEMVFFSSQNALDTWKQAHRADGRSIPLRDAVRHGAELFGRLNQPIGGTSSRSAL